MTEPRITQAVLLTVQSPNPPPIRITQGVTISVQGPPNTPTIINQAVVISVVLNNVYTIALGDPIKLNCWQPCTSYGTTATIVYLGD